MGTSASFRAPEQPRWSAFIAALISDAPIERVRSELFNAGSDWEDALSGPAIASFANAVVRLHEELPDRLAQGQRADEVLNTAIIEARHASLETGFSAATALAERALARLLVGTLQGANEESSVALTQWEAHRGAAIELVAKYAGEILGQYARHVTDREAGRLVGARLGAEVSARLSDSLAARAVSIGTAVASDAIREISEISETWPRVVARAFEVGRALPQENP